MTTGSLEGSSVLLDNWGEMEGRGREGDRKETNKTFTEKDKEERHKEQDKQKEKENEKGVKESNSSNCLLEDSLWLTCCGWTKSISHHLKSPGMITPL